MELRARVYNLNYFNLILNPLGKGVFCICLLLTSIPSLSQFQWFHNPECLLSDTIVHHYTEESNRIEIFNCLGLDTLSKLDLTYSRYLTANVIDSAGYSGSKHQFELIGGDVNEKFQVQFGVDTTLLIVDNEVFNVVFQDETAFFSRGFGLYSVFNFSNLSIIYDVDSIKIKKEHGCFKKHISTKEIYENGKVALVKTRSGEISRKEAEHILLDRGINKSADFDWGYYVVCYTSIFDFHEKQEYLYLFKNDKLLTKYCFHTLPDESWTIYRFH